MREAKATLFWLAVLVIVGGAAFWWWQRQPPAELDSSRPDGAQEVTVHFLQDGDSLEVVALAPGPVIPVTEPVQLRLLGIDAPEMHGADGLPECGAEAAKAELSQLAPHGGRLWIINDVQRQDNYGRYLVFAWTPSGVLVNAALAEAGVVKELFIRPNDGYLAELTEKFEEARAARRGLWGSCIS